MAQSLFLEKDSPVEFLYLDRQRLASLAGQMSDRGTLVGLKSVFQKTQSKEGKASSSVVVASAEGRVSGTSSEASEETYDPFWTHAYSFLRDLEDNFAVPLDAARMGSLVKFDGLVQFLDMKIMRNLWEPTLKAALRAQNADAPKTASAVPSNRKHRREQQRPQVPIPDSARFSLDVMKEVPHLLHMTFLGPGGFRFGPPPNPTT